MSAWMKSPPRHFLIRDSGEVEYLSHCPTLVGMQVLLNANGLVGQTLRNGMYMVMLNHECLNPDKHQSNLIAEAIQREYWMFNHPSSTFLIGVSGPVLVVPQVDVVLNNLPFAI
jgi:hypothetical protein